MRPRPPALTSPEKYDMPTLFTISNPRTLWSLLLQREYSDHTENQQAINQQPEMASRIRQIYKQVNMELMASYTYMSMACYFDRDDVAYYGFSSYFKKNSDEEREHSEKFIKYQNKRGGKVVFQ